MMASFSAFGGDFPSIALIVLHSLRRVCPVVQCLHELSPCVSPMFICCSGDLVVHLLLSLSSISLRYRFQFAFFKLKLVRLGMGLIVRSICKLMRIGRWSEPRFVEVITEADAGGDGLALPGSLVGESQLRILKLEPYIIFSNRVPLVSVEFEYHAEWCALKSPSIRVSVVIIR